MLKRILIISICLPFICGFSRLGRGEENMNKYYDKLYAQWQIQTRGKDPIKDFNQLPVAQDFLAQKARVLPYLMTKLKEGDTSVSIIISKISRAGLNIVLDPKISDQTKAKWLLDWWQKSDEEIAREVKELWGKMLEEGAVHSSPRDIIEKHESGKKIMSLGIAILPYLVREIENIETSSRDGCIMRTMIELLVDANFYQKVRKAGEKLTNENYEKAVLKWWEDNKEDWILKKNIRL